MTFMAVHFDRPDPTGASSDEVQQVLDLLRADEVISGGVATKYRAGTDQVLLRKHVRGSTCVDTVSLTQDPPA